MKVFAINLVVGLYILALIPAHAQEGHFHLDRFLITPFCATVSNNGYILTSSIGEPCVSTLKAVDKSIVTEGFQQGFINPTDKNNTKISFVSIRPNPVYNYLRITFKFADNYIIEVYGITGSRIMHQQVVDDRFFDLDFRHLSQGVYLVQIYSLDRQLNTTFKIEKY